MTSSTCFRAKNKSYSGFCRYSESDNVLGKFPNNQSNIKVTFFNCGILNNSHHKKLLKAPRRGKTQQPVLSQETTIIIGQERTHP